MADAHVWVACAEGGLQPRPRPLPIASQHRRLSHPLPRRASVQVQAPESIPTILQARPNNSDHSSTRKLPC